MSSGGAASRPREFPLVVFALLRFGSVSEAAVSSFESAGLIPNETYLQGPGSQQCASERVFFCQLVRMSVLSYLLLLSLASPAWGV